MKLILVILVLGCTYSHADVHIDADRDRYFISGEMEVKASSSVAWKVLTDYTRMPEFLPAIEFSTVTFSSPTVLYVEQHLIVKVWWVKHRASVLLKIYENPQKDLVFEDIFHTDFTDYRGSWVVTPDANGTTLRYTLSIAIRDNSVPEFLIKRVMKREASDLLENLKIEMERVD